MSNEFDPDSYLDYLKEKKVKEMPEEYILELILECNKSIASYESEYDEAYKSLENYREKHRKYLRGERKTKPYPINNGIDWQYVKERYNTWSKYWKRKKSILEKELERRKGTSFITMTGKEKKARPSRPPKQIKKTLLYLVNCL